MNKKIIFIIMIAVLLSVGCGKKDPTVPSKQSEQPAKTKGIAIDERQYLKKTWIRDTDTQFPAGGGLTIVISNIAEGSVKGEVDIVGDGPGYHMDSAEFEGILNNNTVECQLMNDSRGNKGTITLVFKNDQSIEASIVITEKSKDTLIRLPEGTFQFKPYNLNDIKGLEVIEEQSFLVDLNSWGNVRFVSAKLTAGDHVPVVFYLTDAAGDILYSFNSNLPYSVDVSAVSFKDLNHDEWKDIIIIADNHYNGSSGNPIANVYFQKSDGTFEEDLELNEKINASGNNKDISAVTNYMKSMR